MQTKPRFAHHLLKLQKSDQCVIKIGTTVNKQDGKLWSHQQIINEFKSIFSYKFKCSLAQAFYWGSFLLG